MTEEAKPKPITTMIKQELYEEVKISRLTIAKYKETMEQIDTYKSCLDDRTKHINMLQEKLLKLEGVENSLELAVERNLKLEGDLVDALNNPLASQILNPSAATVASQIFSDIEKLYKDKINRFDEMKEEHDKCKKILLNLNVGLNQINWLDFNYTGVFENPS